MTEKSFDQVKDTFKDIKDSFADYDSAQEDDDDLDQTIYKERYSMEKKSKGEGNSAGEKKKRLQSDDSINVDKSGFFSESGNLADSEVAVTQFTVGEEGEDKSANVVTPDNVSRVNELEEGLLEDEG
jgi:hypothetical protein